MTRFPIDRLPVTLMFQDQSGFKETYGGNQDWVLCEGQFLKPKEAPPCKTIVLFMHPSGTMNYLPMPIALAHAGIPVMTCGSRYPHNDTALIMEKVLIDLGRYVRHAKTVLGFEKVVLAGWSGGGSLSLFYQAQAEKPTIEATPAGDLVDIVGAGLIPADGVMQLAAHVSRAITLSEWIDPAIVDELNPDKRDAAFDIYAPDAPHRPPYSEAFQATYRAAQRARIAAITADVRQRLEDFKKRGEVNREHCFVVHGTMADLRWLDPSIDPNQRRPNWCYMGDPKTVNMSAAHLARYSSLRSWLSQWSEESRADGPACAALVTVPALVLENLADDACTPSHAARIRAGFTQVTPHFHAIDGATHYYLGQPAKVAEAVTHIQSWMEENKFIG
ncbi:alpha/beta fold hydrolase [Aquidulcibacter paucihalophilus]|uniref:alpha/beta fold hydrolase n=1 Tax=Aquidulcibacter paucihalophilus TaxID=1978549 RepID=UPI0018E3A773|nr:alpha/beta hydrolase [Aquidulcibacter paucihalophilus]